MRVVFLADESTGVSYSSEVFAQKGIELVVSYSKKADDIVALSMGTDVFLVSAAPFPAEVIERLDSTVKGIVRLAVGYDIIDIKAASKRGIAVCNIPDYCCQEVATMAFSLFLCGQRKIIEYNNFVKRDEWHTTSFLLPEKTHRLSSLTLGLVGFGRIARYMAQYAKGFGMRVAAYDPNLPEEVFQQNQVEKMRLEELYHCADVISIHVPLRPTTFHMLDRRAFTQMKPGVILINVSRGALICEADLVDALKTKHVSFAAVDVYEHEPATTEVCELMRLQNVITTPHIAWYSEEARQDLQDKGFAAAVQLIRGQLPNSTVNKERLEEYKN